MVNNPPLQVPLYWFANQGIVAPLLEKAGVLSFAPKAQVDFFPFHFFSFLSQYQTRHLASLSVLLFGSCHLILFVSSTNSIQILRRQCCLASTLFT